MVLTHLTDRRRGPSVAPRTHMGRPVCAASKNFTTTSPVGKKQQKNFHEMKNACYNAFLVCNKRKKKRKLYDDDLGQGCPTLFLEIYLLAEFISNPYQTNTPVCNYQALLQILLDLSVSSTPLSYCCSL